MPRPARRAGTPLAMEQQPQKIAPHMHDRYERFFSPKALLGINLVFILATETIGGGRFMYDSGFIHLPALLFLFLASVRIFGRYRIYDSAAKRFLGWSLTALALLLLSHAVEFADQNFDDPWPWPRATVYGAVFTIHLAAFLAVTVGAFPILKAFGKMRTALIWASVSTLVALLATLESLAAVAGLIPSVPPMLYVAIALVSGIATVAPTISLAKVVPLLEDFSSYLTSALVFSTFAAGVDALHLLADVDEAFYRQATYISLFAFYAALSCMFLAFGKLANSGGLFDLLPPEQREVRGAARGRH